MQDLDSLLPQVSMRPPCPPEVMDDFLAYVGPVPQADYLAFMQKHNGCDGPVGREAYLRIWPLDEAVIGTEEAGTPESAPGLLLFGGDGGDTVYGFDRQDPRWPIVSVSLTCMSRNEMRRIAPTFSDFVKQLAADEL